MESPFFSIIIPTLNEEHYLPHLLKDLKGQTCQDFETIVVDGNSDDKTQEISKKFKTKLIISDKKNVAHQRNLGAKNAHGKYLLFIDADTRIINNTLFLIKNSLYQKIDFFSTKLSSYSNHQIIDKLFNFHANLIFSLTAKINRPASAAMFLGCKKTVFNQVRGFDETINLCEDHHFCHKCVTKGYKFKLFNKPRVIMSYRRFHKEGHIVVLYKYFLSSIFYIFNKNHLQNKITYKMGGYKNQ